MTQAQEPNTGNDQVVPLDRDSFMQTMLRELAGVLQDTIGLRDARGFVSIVGARMGDAINDTYRRTLGSDTLNADQVAHVFVDLKKRIDGDFHVISQNADEIVLGNNRCPFGPKVRGKPAMCMMTSNVFGRIAAENLGYARVRVDESFADGHDRCLVRVALTRGKDQRKDEREREYYRVGRAQDHAAIED
ncbi:MAG: methanogen output domain 1-containing protein [Rhodospirillales bacterium]